MTPSARAWRLGLAAWLLIAVFTRTGTSSSHEWSRLGTVESIVERQNFWLEESKFRGTRDKIYRDGHYYSHQPPLLATLTSPVYWVLHQFGLRLSNSAPRDPAFYLFVLFTNGVAFAVTIVMLREALALLGVPGLLATVAALVLPFGTWLFPYGVVTNNHGISAALLMCLGYAMLSIEQSRSTIWSAGLLGASLGLMTAFEVVPLVSFVPTAALFAWWRRDRIDPADRLAMATWFVLPLLAHAVLNIPITGDLVPAGFHTELFDFEGTTFTAGELTGSIKHTSAAALWDYTVDALFAGKGFFTLAPVMAIGIVTGLAGWRWWARARGTQLVLLLGSAASLAAALMTTNNLGGAAVGFRHATYLAPAWLILLAPLFASRRRAAGAAAWMALLIAALSAVMLWRYAAQQPWIDLRLPVPIPFTAAGTPADAFAGTIIL